MSVTDAPFTNPALPPSMHQTEQQRQATVAAMRNDVYRSGIEGPFPAAADKADGVPWVLLAVLALATAYAVGQRTAEVRIGELTAPLEARIATLEAQNVNLRNRLAVVDADVEKKIEAWAMIEANEIVKAQEEPRP